MRPSVIFMGAAGLLLMPAAAGGCDGQGGSGGTAGSAAGGTSTGTTTSEGGSAGQGGTAAGGAATGGTAAGGTGGSPSGAGDLVLLGTTNGGPGCPGPATVTASYDARGRTLVLSFPSLDVEHHAASGFAHTSCVTGLTIKGAPGWQFAATGATVHGTADLPAGTSARVKTTVFFAGKPDSAELTSTLDGPSQGAFHMGDDFAGTSLLRAACGEDVIYNIQVAITLDTGTQDTAAVAISGVELPIVWSGC